MALTNDNADQLRARLQQIVWMCSEKLALLQGDDTPTDDLWVIANELFHIRAMAEGTTPVMPQWDVKNGGKR